MGADDFPRLNAPKGAEPPPPPPPMAGPAAPGVAHSAPSPPTGNAPSGLPHSGPAPHATSGAPPVSDQTDLQRTVSAIIKVPQERPPDPTTPVGLMWRVFDVTSNWLILVLAIVNLMLVFFDYTYVDMRHLYQANGLTHMVETYDHVKGIEPHRVTDTYAKAAHKTFTLLANQPDSPEAAAAIDEMRRQSLALLKEDPFAPSGQRGVSEQLKSRFRRHEWDRTAESDERQAWERTFSLVRLEALFTLKPRPWDHLSVTTAMIGSQAAAQSKGQLDRENPPVYGFWSAENLQPARLQYESQFFERQIEPLLNRNYWQTYSEDGGTADRFWIIDCFFLPLFLLEFIIRGTVGVKRKIYPSFQAFFATRWYDAVYFLPIVVYALPPSLQGPLHLVRFVSVSARMERLGLINPVAVIQARVAAHLDLITDLVNVKLLSNYQDGVRNFDLEASMNTLTPAQRAQLANTIERTVAMVIGKVVPDITDELERLITHTAALSLEQAPAYKQLRGLPFFGQIPEQLMARVVTETITQMQVTMLRSVNDPENVRLTKELITEITESLLRHMAEIGTENELKAIVIDVLEEQKAKIRDK